ncbi:hypothetical protein B0H14DRAFT_2372750 [Mycena olivaceomarginata]|nr:hypothetical protein B0H14DRAFT_2372750 [Mycena olivaceomarginata]
MSTLVFSIPTFNITIPVPEGTSNHGDPSILCTPTNWTSILSFFFGNYLAHATTTLASPGEELFEYAQTVALALLFPSAGIQRGLGAIFRHAVCAKSDLMCAARAGALCIVIHTDEWEPDQAQYVNSNVPSYRPELVRHGQYLDRVTHKHLPWWRFLEAPCDGRKIHGVVKSLPLGYKFEMVPQDAVVIPRKIPAGADAQSVVICTSRQTAKVVVAIWQTLYGAATLYRARGDQLARYGYAVFALTVTPYTVMSVVNLLGALLTPSYPTIYLVRSEVMDELDRRHGDPGPYFDGTVRRSSYEFLDLFTLLSRSKTLDRGGVIVLAVSCGIPLAIIGGLTKFRPGDSTHSQRVWLMMWLGFNFVGPALTQMRWGLNFAGPTLGTQRHPTSRFDSSSVFLLGFLMYSVPAIGGMVVVGKMIKEYGDCIRLD